jgi:hypothetical protein
MTDRDTHGDNVDDTTLESERRQAGMGADPGRPPTPEEERAAERHRPDPDAADHARETNRRGAEVEGEGRID